MKNIKITRRRRRRDNKQKYKETEDVEIDRR